MVQTITYTREFLYRLRKQPATDQICKRAKQLGIFRYRSKRGGRKVSHDEPNATAYPEGRKRYGRDAASTQRLKLLLFNARSIKNKIEECAWLVDIQDAAFVGITETWLTPDTPDHEVAPLQYSSHRSDRTGRAGGGVCTLVRDEWSTHRINHDIYIPPFIDVVMTFSKLPIMPRLITGIIIILLYVPPNVTRQNSKNVCQCLAHLVDFTKTKYPSAKIVMMGDLNLLPYASIAQATGLQQVVRHPTRGNNILDVVFTDFDNTSISILPPIGTSDHSVVCMEIPKSSDLPLPPKAVRVGTRPKPEHAVNEAGLRLATYDWSCIYRETNINDKYSKFKECIADVFEDHFPTKMITVYPRSKPWYSENIHKIMEIRDRAFRRGDRQTYLKLRSKVQQEIIKAKRDHYQKKVSKLRYCEPKRWHKVVKTITGAIKSTKHVIECDVDLMNKHFVSYGTPRVSSTPPLQDLPDREEPPQMYEYEVSRLLSRISLNKSQPLHDCPAYMLKTYHVELAAAVAHMFNFSLKTASLPEDWTRIQVTPVPKVARPHLPDDYRPIGVMPILMKVMEGYITDIVKRAKHQQHGPHQFGGRKGLSTSHYLVTLLEYIHSSVEDHKIVRLAAVDIAKAYNCVNHDDLVGEIESLQLHPVITNWIFSLLYSLTQVVRIPGTNVLSTPLPVTAGVPQGMALANELFLTHVDDIPGDNKWTFIDDLTSAAADQIYRQVTGTLQTQLQQVADWLQMKKMAANPKKSSEMAIDFSARAAMRTPTPLQLEGVPIPPSTEIKILGVTIQSDLRFDAQVEMMLKKARTRMYFLRRLCSIGIPKEDLRVIYLNYIRPILEYAAPVWDSALTVFQSEQLEAIQERASKLITRNWAQSYSHNMEELDIQPLQLRREKQSLTLAWKMFCSEQFRHMFPPLRSTMTQATTRNSNKLFIPRYRTTRRAKSPIPHFVKLLNSSELL